MANRRMGGGFDGSYTRRPGSGNSMQSSLLGEPPGQKIQPYSINQGGGGTFGGQGQQQQFGPAFGQQNQSRQSSNFEDSYSRRDKDADFFGSSNRSSFGLGGSGGGREDFGSPGSGPQFQSNRVPRDREDFRVSGSGDGWRQRSPSPRGNSGKFGGQDGFGRQDMGDWGRNQFDGRQQSGGMPRQSHGMGNLNISQNPTLPQGSGQGQPVVMVVPQGNTGAGGLMGMVQASQNPFNVVQRQQPMQVIVGNLPAFNADFGQQILAAASVRPLGQGMMGGPQLGLMNQQRQHPQLQQQQFNRYDRSVAEGGNRSISGTGRFSRPSNQRSSSGRATLNRRSDNASGSVKIARTSTTSTTLRGNRKRGILRDRHGATEEIERKRPRPNAAQNRARNALNKAKGGNNKANNKKKPAPKDTENETNKAEQKQDKTETISGDQSDAADGAAKNDTEDSTLNEGDDKEKKKSKYDEFPTSFLVCKVCQKVMSDGASFESHLNGRAHSALVKILEGRFQKRAELLMFESKLGEEEIGIERERQRRAGKSGHSGKGSKNFCKMCDCNYSVNWGTHKVSMGHRVLKEYLHPSCNFCSTNFVHRMDWVNHLHSSTHLRKLAELKEQGVDVSEHESAFQDELFAVNLELGKDERPYNVLTIRHDYKTPLKEDLKEILKDEKGELNVLEGQIELPKEYEENKVYGEDSVFKVEGACCKVCRIYIVKTNDIDAHLKSKPHYGMYVGYLKKVLKCREALKVEAEKKAADEAARIEREKNAAEEEAQKSSLAAAVSVKEEKQTTQDEDTENKLGDRTAVVDVNMSDVEMAEKVDTTVTGETIAQDSIEEGGTGNPEEVTGATKDDGADTALAKTESEQLVDAASPARIATDVSPGTKAAVTNVPVQQTRGGQQGRGRGASRGNRGSGTPVQRGGARGRGNQHTPQRGGGTPRGGGGIRGRTPTRGGGDNSNWRGRGGRGGRFQR